MATGLGSTEDGAGLTWKSKLVNVLKVGFAVLLCAKVQDAASPETVLHSHLHRLRAASCQTRS